eukprot:scaffold21262_cov30-Tisochrysis_lutea.AAC.6
MALLSLVLLPLTQAQTSALYELSAANLRTALSQPVTWLLAVEPGAGAGLTPAALHQVRQRERERGEG